MTTTTTDASVRLTVSLPDAGAGRFYFSVVRLIGGRVKALDPAAVGSLFPELAEYLPLHDAEHDGTPCDVEVRAWYHMAGICFPGTEGADPSDRLECARRLIALLRIPASRVADIVTRMQAAREEFPSPRAVYPIFLVQLQELRAVWRRQADEALMNLPMILGATTAAAIPVAATTTEEST